MIQKYINSKQKTLKQKIIQCLGNISKNFTINKKSVDFNPIDTNDILEIHRYLI